jgi:hypothetical protein
MGFNPIPQHQLHLVASPRMKPPPSNQQTKDVTSVIFQCCTAPGGSNLAEATYHNMFQAKSSSIVVAASAIL